MKISINFSEIQNLVHSKTGREVVLSVVDERTVKAETKMSVKVPFFGKIEKSVGLNVTVEQIDGQNIYLKYDGGMGTDMIIGGLLTFLSSSSFQKMMERTHDNGIVVHLNAIEKAQKVLEIVALIDIAFQNESVVVVGKLRN